MVDMTLVPLLSDPILQAKLSTHRMYVQDQLFHIYKQKVFADNPNVMNKVYLLHK
jgi:hypothetical protein